MSGLVKGVKKVFKKVTSFVKKYWKPILAAVAIYFTAGVALSYFGSTAAFSASMPGFGAGGIFSKAAVWMGFSGGAGSGIAATAALKAAGAAGGAAAGLTGATGATGINTGAGVGVAGTGIGVGDAGAAFVMPGSKAALAAGSAQATTAAAAGAGAGTSGITAALTGKEAVAGVAKETASQVAANAATSATQSTAVDAMTKSLNTMTKLSMVKMGIDTVSGLLAPDPYEEAKKMHALQYASSFGVDREGNDAFGWGNSDSAQMWANMNKREGGYGSNVGYGQPAGQSQFRDTPFLPTPQESSTPRMPDGGNQQFIPTRGAA